MIKMMMKWMLNQASLSQILLYHTVWNKNFFTKLIFVVYYLATSKTLRYWFYWKLSKFWKSCRPFWINHFVKWNFNLKFVISGPKNPCMQNFRFVEEQLLLLASFSRFPTTVRRGKLWVKIKRRASLGQIWQTEYCQVFCRNFTLPNQPN